MTKTTRILAVTIPALLLLVYTIFFVYGTANSAVSTVAPTSSAASPLNVGTTLNFTIYNWVGDALSIPQKVYVCKLAGCSGCDDVVKTNCWTYNEAGLTSPIKLQYVIQNSDSTAASTTWYYRLVNSTGSSSAVYTGSGSVNVNHAPSFSQVVITPASPTPTQDLICTGTYSDPDNNPVTATCGFQGCTGGCGSCNAICASGSCTATLSNTFTTFNDLISCNMTPRDNFNFAGSNVISSAAHIVFNGGLAIVPFNFNYVQKGSTQIFNASNALTPVVWSVKNSTGASVCTLSGMVASQVTLTGVSVGNCTLNVTDSTARSAVSGWIVVRDTDPPAPVTNLIATDVAGDQGNSTRIAWALSTDDGANDNDIALASGYRILRSTTPNAGYVNIANRSSGTALYIDTGLTAGTSYYYKVRVCDTAGLCTDSLTYAVAVPNAQPRMSSVIIRPDVLRAGTDVECIGVGYDMDQQPLDMYYAFTVMPFPPGNTTRQTITGMADCIFFGRNTTDQYGVHHDNATSECRAVLSQSYISKADKVVCEMTASDGQENSTVMRILQAYIPVNNTAPFATNVVVNPLFPNATSTLTCNYTYNDIDHDAEDKASTQYRWYINNEGLNSFVEVQNQNSKTLSGIFDRDDIVKCAVLVKDSDISWMHQTSYASSWAVSEPVKISDNALPQIIAYNTNNNISRPVNVGSQVLFNVSWVDYEDPQDIAQLFVCEDFKKEEPQYKGANASVHFGDDQANSPVSVWFYTNKTGLYVHTIAIKPFKFIHNNEWTYAAQTPVQAGDKFIGSLLRNFTTETYADTDGSGTYTFGESIILDNATGGTRYVYDPGVDIVLVGTSPPVGTVLVNLSGNNRHYVDRDSNNRFSSPDDIYWDRNADFMVSIGDFRDTIVTEGSVRRDSTPFSYGIQVYEVTAIGDTDRNASSLMIAHTHNDPFTLGKYNFFTPEFNAQPLAGKHLAFRLCMDNNNDGICDSDNNFANDSVYVHADISGGQTDYKVVTGSGQVFFNPEIKINYQESSDKGCAHLTYCNTSLSSQSPQVCTYTAKDSDLTANNFVIKVCDQKGGCSVERGGIFFVNHAPSVSRVSINSSTGFFADNANLNCTTGTVFDKDNNTVTLKYTWYVRRNSTYLKYDIPSNRILTNGNTVIGDSWICEVTPTDSYSNGLKLNSTPVLIANSSFASSALYISSVFGNFNSSRRVNVGDPVEFNAVWGSPITQQVRMFVCNSSSILDNGCWDYTFAATQLTSQNPIIGSYVAKESDFTRNFWVMICNAAGNCSNNFPGLLSKINFTVNHRPTISIVNISSSRGNFTDVANLNCSVYGKQDKDNDTVSVTYNWYVMRGSSFELVNLSSSATLANSNTFVNDIWKCQATPYDGFAYGPAQNSTPVFISDSSLSAGPLKIVRVIDNSNSTSPTNIGNSVNFLVVYSGTTLPVKVFICNSSEIYSNGCGDYTFASSGPWFGNPVILSYSVKESDNEENYWTKLCTLSGNCSASFPSVGTTNFSVNHRPNATQVKVLVSKTLISNFWVCNYSFVDMDGDTQLNASYEWYLAHNGVKSSANVFTKNFTNTANPGDIITCAVQVTDQHGLSSADYSTSTNNVTVGLGAPTPILWPLPSDIRSNTINITGYVGLPGFNVTAFAGQNYLDPKVNSVISTVSSNLIGISKLVDDIPRGKRFIIVSQADSELFTASRFIEFVSYSPYENITLDRFQFSRYSIIGKSNLFDGTFRIDLGENLSDALLGLNDDDSFYTVAYVYNSSKPTGWFSIQLNLFNESNALRVFAQNGFGKGGFATQSVFVDLYPPTIDLSDIPSVTSTSNISLRFNVSDNRGAWNVLNYLLLNIKNVTSVKDFKPANFSHDASSIFLDSNRSISCSSINFTHASCHLDLNLRNGTYNISFSANDTAGWHLGSSKQMTVNTTVIVVTTVNDGYYDADGKHLPSDFATTSNLTANWTAMTGIDYYQFRLDQYNGSLFDRTVVNWTSVGKNTSVNVSRGITNGYVYHFAVRAKASSGGFTGISRSDGILYLDATSPTCIDCVHSAGDFVNTNDSLHFYWNFTEHESAIVEYRYAIGSKCYPFPGFDDVVATKVTSVSSITEHDLHLIDGASYCVSVKARNVNNIWSSWRSANVTLDYSAPFNGTINYTDGYISGDTTTVRFTQGKDSISGINKTMLEMASCPLVQNECSCIFDFNNAANFTSTVLGQTFKTVHVQPGRCYRFQYRVFDNAGNSVVYPRGMIKTLKVDTTPPTSFNVVLNNNQFYTEDNTFTARWTPATDSESGIRSYMYALFSNGVKVSTSSYRNTTQTSAQLTAALLHNQPYNVQVTAFDKAGLSTTVSSNTVLFLDFTPPSPVSVIAVDNDTNASNGWLDNDLDNTTTIAAVGEMGISCIISPYDIDYTDDFSLPYITHCNLTGMGPNMTCPVSNVPEGNYTYFITCRDNNGNTQDSSQNAKVNWIVHKYGPNITIIKPLPGETVGGRIILKAEVRDTVGVSQASYQIRNLAGRILKNGTIKGRYWNDTWDTVNKNYSGIHFFTIMANDTLGKRSNKTVNFTINNGKPVLELVHPQYTNGDFTLLIRSQLFVNVSFNITNRTRQVIAYRKNDSAVMRNYIVWQNLVQASSLNQAKEGVYNITAWAVNNRTNVTKKKSWFILDRTSPRFSNVQNTSIRQYYRNDTINFTVTWADNFRFAKIMFAHNATASGNWTNVTYTSNRSKAYRVTIPAFTIPNSQSIGWYSFAADMANNTNQTILQTFTLGNYPPRIANLSNITVNATDPVILVVQATDADRDDLTYSINDSVFTQVNNIFSWDTGLNDFGQRIVTVNISDGRVQVQKKIWVTVQYAPDTDGDGIPDFKETDSDNDGLPNTIDYLNGFCSNIRTNLVDLNCSVISSYNITQKFNLSKLFNSSAIFNISGKKNWTSVRRPVLMFPYDFGLHITLNMIRINITRQPDNATAGYVIVSGLRLLNTSLKTVYLDKIDSSISSVCVKDRRNATSAAQISTRCNASDEYTVPCNGQLYYGKYSCTEFNNSYFQVTGLTNSAVRQQNGCTSRDGDAYGIGALCLGVDCDDSNANVPSPNACPSVNNGGGSSSRSSGGGGGGGISKIIKKNATAPLENWVCTEWSDCSLAGEQSRQCVDTNKCGTYNFIPQQTRKCTPVIPAVISPTCYDGLQNDGETGLDCGGNCPPCPTCVDGILNQGETSVDCGGPCPSCNVPVPTPSSPPFVVFILGFVVLLLLISIAVLYSRISSKAPQPRVIIPPTVDLPLRQQRLLEAQKFVLHKLHDGIPRSEIEEALKSKGWSTDIINKMIKLENYVRAGKEKGYGYEVIKQSLQKVGWRPEIVDEIILFIEQPGT